MFKVMFRKAKYHSCKHITLYALKDNKQDDKNYIGICVSKKHGNSVVRNKLKRWAREVYKINEKNLKKGYLLVILYKKDINVAEVNYNVVVSEFEKSIKSLGICEDE